MINITDVLAQKLLPALAVLTLGSLLLAGAAGWWGLRQHGKAAAAEAACETRVQKLLLDAVQAGYDESNSQSEQIAAESYAAQARIEAAFAELADQQRRDADRYAARIGALSPMPGDCGPGQDRVDAFNDW